VRLAQGIEVGNIFKLGSDFTVALGATYLADDGSRRHPIMGSYGIGLGRAMACVVEAHHDQKGIVWPVEVAPYRVHLVAIGAAKDPAVGEAADALYERLTDAGISVLYDDRDESPGVKLTDAELLGMPTILTVSPRSLAAGGVEVTDRASGARDVRPADEVVTGLVGA
jgi:prolyl-tRNA synthetase